MCDADKAQECLRPKIPFLRCGRINLSAGVVAVREINQEQTQDSTIPLEDFGFEPG